MSDSSVSAPNNKELTELSDLAKQQLQLMDEIATVEQTLEALKEQLKHVQESTLPDLMLSLGMSEFRLNNGYRITVKPDIYASIRADKITHAVDWLDEQGLGDVVKDDVTVKFGRGEAEQAKILLAFCRNHKFNAGEKLSVHPQTLKALIKEQLAKGIEFPDEYFSIAALNKAIIHKK